jgi:CBS domain-containing protein
MFRVEEVMEKDVVTVKKDMPIYEAVELMLANEISGVPVVDDQMHLVGVLSEKDVVNLLYDSGYANKKVVRDFMTMPPIAFEKDGSLLDVCDFLAKNVFRRVPIIHQKKVVGIISVPDILRCALKLKESRESEAEVS